MTIFDFSSSSLSNHKFEKLEHLRSILSSPAISKPIPIKSNSSSHTNQKCMDVSYLVKAKLNESLNQVRVENESKAELEKRVPFKSYKKLDWSWNYEMDCCCNLNSPPVLLSNDSKGVCFHPYCTSCFETNAIRGNKPLKLNAFTYWEITLSDGICAGTSVMVGIGTRNSKLNSNGYINLIGGDRFSWGLSNKGFIWHDNKSHAYCYPFDESRPVRIGCLFDGYNGRLAFFKDGVFMGVAFSSLPIRNKCGIYDYEHELYPMVSSTVSKSLIRLEFACENFASLKDLCREQVQEHFLFKNFKQSLVYLSNSESGGCGNSQNFYEVCFDQTIAGIAPRSIIDFLSNKA